MYRVNVTGHTARDRSLPPFKVSPLIHTSHHPRSTFTTGVARSTALLGKICTMCNRPSQLAANELAFRGVDISTLVRSGSRRNPTNADRRACAFVHKMATEQ